MLFDSFLVIKEEDTPVTAYCYMSSNAGRLSNIVVYKQ